MPTRRLAPLVLALAAAGACTPGDKGRASACADCGTVVIAAAGEPSALLPPLVVETIGRDVGDLIYERLADLAPGGAPVDSAAFRPGLAQRWERIELVTGLELHLRADAPPLLVRLAQEIHAQYGATAAAAGGAGDGAGPRR